MIGFFLFSLLFFSFFFFLPQPPLTLIRGNYIPLAGVVITKYNGQLGIDICGGPNILAAHPYPAYLSLLHTYVCDIKRRQNKESSRIVSARTKEKDSPNNKNNGLIVISAPLGRVFGLGQRRLRPASAQSPEDQQQFEAQRSGVLRLVVLLIRPSATAFALPRPLRGPPSRWQGRRPRPPRRSQTVHSARAGQLADARLRGVYVFREESAGDSGGRARGRPLFS